MVGEWVGGGWCERKGRSCRPSQPSGAELHTRWLPANHSCKALGSARPAAHLAAMAAMCMPTGAMMPPLASRACAVATTCKCGGGTGALRVEWDSTSGTAPV